ncbi:unnamed protein product, partial [Discosporangium mesarthrocarpum]
DGSLSLPQQPEPDCCDGCTIGFLKGTDACFPWFRWPCLCGLCPLLLRRKLQNKFNLLDVSRPQIPPYPDRSKPSAAGHFHDLDNSTAGASGTEFGRNTPGLAPSRRRLYEPSPFLVAQKLLARRESGKDRTYFKPAGNQLNIMAAAWIQAMVHDWMDHAEGEASELSGGERYGCPMSSFHFNKTKEVMAKGGFPAHINPRTHWWDGSLIYGNNDNTLKETRTFVGGCVKIDEGLLHHDPVTGAVATGDPKNSWVGVTLLQVLLSLEHNAIAQHISSAHPDFDGKLTLIAEQ